MSVLCFGLSESKGGLVDLNVRVSDCGNKEHQFKMNKEKGGNISF